MTQETDQTELEWKQAEVLIQEEVEEGKFIVVYEHSIPTTYAVLN